MANVTGLLVIRPGKLEQFCAAAFSSLSPMPVSRGHFQDVSRVEFLSALSLAPLHQSGLPTRASMSAVMASTDLEIFLCRAGREHWV